MTPRICDNDHLMLIDPATARVSYGPREDYQLVLDSAGKPIKIDLDS